MNYIKYCVIVLVCIFCLDPAFASEFTIPFQSTKVLDALLVTIQVNGRSAVLIFDTGSNITILSPEISKVTSNPRRFKVWFPEGDRREKATWGRVELTIGGRLWNNHLVVVKDQEQLSEMLGQRIDGILGKDLLNEFKSVTIDFELHQIVFRN